LELRATVNAMSEDELLQTIERGKEADRRIRARGGKGLDIFDILS
jgi:hypothetical protein